MLVLVASTSNGLRQTKDRRLVGYRRAGPEPRHSGGLRLEVVLWHSSLGSMGCSDPGHIAGSSQPPTSCFAFADTAADSPSIVAAVHETHADPILCRVHI